MAEPASLPHLIHIGYPKAGSTFLQVWFAAHPQIAYAEGGIAGYRDVWSIAAEAVEPNPDHRLRATSAEALSTPTEWAGGGGHWHGSQPTLAADSVERASAHLGALFPTASVLIVTRGFRSAIASTYSQLVREGLSLPFNRDTVALAVAERGAMWDYDGIIAAYTSRFERVLVLPYEMLRDDPDGFTRGLEVELGLDHAELPLARVNEALSPLELAWYPRLSGVLMDLPLPGRWRQRALNRWTNVTRRNGLARGIRLLQKVRPVQPWRDDALTDDLLDTLRGRSESLRANPLYAPYRDDYLLTP